jgi:ATP-dependent phosphoenolpyruvate carboxykinase
MSFVSRNGALCAFSGRNTERKGKNSRLVKDSITNNLVDWN